jgi:hypothetical protein
VLGNNERANYGHTFTTINRDLNAENQLTDVVQSVLEPFRAKDPHFLFGMGTERALPRFEADQEILEI